MVIVRFLFEFMIILSSRCICVPIHRLEPCRGFWHPPWEPLQLLVQIGETEREQLQCSGSIWKPEILQARHEDYERLWRGMKGYEGVENHMVLDNQAGNCRILSVSMSVLLETLLNGAKVLAQSAKFTEDFTSLGRAWSLKPLKLWKSSNVPWKQEQSRTNTGPHCETHFVEHCGTFWRTLLWRFVKRDNLVNSAMIVPFTDLAARMKWSSTRKEWLPHTTPGLFEKKKTLCLSVVSFQ